MQADEAGQAARAAYKAQAATAAAAAIPDGAVVGLGTGSTADLLLRALAERLRSGLRVTGVATSDRTAALAQQLGIPLRELDAVDAVDVCIDGADEVTLPGLDLLKGLGGALLREKTVALASRLRVTIVDESKLVQTLGARHPVPVEVERFGWRHTAGRLVALGARPTLRPAPGAPSPDATPFVTDGGHYVLDCAFGPLAQPVVLAQQIKAITGVVDCGLFLGLADRVYVAGPAGVRTYDRPQPGS